MNAATLSKTFIDRDKLYSLLDGKTPTDAEVTALLNKALKLKGLELEDVAVLLRVKDAPTIRRIQETAHQVKEIIYGKRLVLFAPVYTGNKCSNSCTYCAFRQENTELKRTVLTTAQIENEVRFLLKQGHKRVLLICGEDADSTIDDFIAGIRAAYNVKEGKASIRRINVEIAPLSVEDFRKLAAEKIGTYICFQETYDPIQYKKYHLKGPKADYENRLYVMDRAMEAGIKDVGIGALFGLGDYRFEVLAIMEHARHLEENFGCGPHTVSVPRIEPADGAPVANHVPHPVSDDDFKKIVALIRIALPYTGIILSTRENETIRKELFQYGISQISAGSRTNPGAYAEEGGDTGAQFSLGDHRTLEEVISQLIDDEYVPSFCTGCYRKGRVGADFMDLAKPGLIKEFCLPNGLFTFREYLNDYATPAVRERGFALMEKITANVGKASLEKKIRDNVAKIDAGERDVYL
ncbi:MAG: [FeFe] hydrogenase H-cluster radical SAM maturase HydG [Spirochaetales bacterium]|nr:[FeFe] hydrogenase H-cluster radical SAM maturase HydG [Spirochaetales bacterium]